ncbi:MAG: BON domain-containing protein [Bacteroidota bacterium]|nr:BON domain-containing protein [Bacteroidota bacterium]
MKKGITSQFPVIFSFLLLLFTLISCGSSDNDPAIQTQVAAFTQTTPELQNVSASVSKGVVTLIGNCRSEKERERAEKTVKKIDHVKGVINNIMITDNVNVSSDSDLKEQVKRVVKKHKHVQAEVNNGVITLRGSIDKDDLQQMMGDLNSLRPKRIDNQLVAE